MTHPDHIRDVLGEEPTVTFAVERITDHEIVGPMKTRNAQYGAWSPSGGSYEYDRPRPMILLNFNKYRPDLPPWSQVREVFFAGPDGSALADVATHLDTSISGRLKTITLGCWEVKLGATQGAVIEREDVTADG